MAESRQHTLDRVRKPRVQITYDVEIGDAIETRELPFVVGVLADLSGHPESPLPKIKERKFVEIDRDNFTEIMGVIHPRLVIRVADKLTNSSKQTSLELLFENMEDFEPQKLARNVPSLAKLFSKRTNLKNLITKMDGNDKLEALLTQVMKDKGTFDRLKQEIEAYDAEHKASSAEGEAASEGDQASEESKEEATAEGGDAAAEESAEEAAPAAEEAAPEGEQPTEEPKTE